jgi:hypothetical protein
MVTSSCYSQSRADKKDIVYIFPKSVDSILINLVKKNDKGVYFYLSKESDGYIVYLSHNAQRGNILAGKSNRKLFLEGNLYPLIFDYDETFGTSESVDQIKKKHVIDKYFSYSKTLTLYHGYFIRFRQNGEIIDTGIDGAKKENSE